MLYHTERRSTVLSFGGAAGLVLLLALLLQGCASSGGNRIVRESTYSQPQSPYEGRVTSVKMQRTDTTTMTLSDTSIVETTRSERCVYQEIVLRAKPQFQSKPYVQYLRARDVDCENPGMVTWESMRLRGRVDRERWNSSPALRRSAKNWLSTYLFSLYFDFPELN